MSFNQYDLANTSLVKTGGLTEMYIPLWYYSSASGGSNSTTSNGTSFVTKGSVNVSASSSSSVKLHTLSSNWMPNQQFAFEASILSEANGVSIYANLYDFTSSTVVTSSQLTTTSNTAILQRSAKFTLVPGHVYGISLYTSISGYYANLTKASLVAFIGG